MISFRNLVKMRQKNSVGVVILLATSTLDVVMDWRFVIQVAGDPQFTSVFYIQLAIMIIQPLCATWVLWTIQRKYEVNLKKSKLITALVVFCPENACLVSGLFCTVWRPAFLKICVWLDWLIYWLIGLCIYVLVDWLIHFARMNFQNQFGVINWCDNEYYQYPYPGNYLIDCLIDKFVSWYSICPYWILT